MKREVERKKEENQREGRKRLKSHMLPSTKIICSTFSMRSSHKFWFHVFFLFWPEDGREG